MLSIDLQSYESVILDTACVGLGYGRATKNARHVIVDQVRTGHFSRLRSELHDNASSHFACKQLLC